MQFRFESSRNEVSTFTTQQIRDNFLIENIFSEDQIELTYSIYDRMIIGGAMPINKTLTLGNPDKLKETIYFIINHYQEIRNDIKKNKLSTKEYFLDNLVSIINNN